MGAPHPYQIYYYPAPAPSNDNGVRQQLQVESKLDLRKPDPFTGRDRTKWRAFLIECMTTFHAKPNTYATDHAKITFAASYFSGIAQNHYASLLEHHPHHQALTSWDFFVREFGNMFGISNMEIFAEQSMRALMMNDRDHFTAHIVRFEEYAFLSQWNYAALQSQLYQSLPKRIKDALRTIPRPPHYLDLRALCLQIDARYWEDEMENRRSYARPLPPTPSAPRDYPHSSTRPASTPYQTRAQAQQPRTNNPTAPVRAQPSTPTPRNPPQSTNYQRPIDQRRTRSQTKRTYVSPVEMERRRRERLCFKCGSPDHMAPDCPDREVVVRAMFSINEDGQDFIESYEIEEEAIESEQDGAEPGDEEAEGNEAATSDQIGEA
jgi:Zinc knuckle